MEALQRANRSKKIVLTVERNGKAMKVEMLPAQDGGAKTISSVASQAK